jgi:histo-blood group ABO system transferase
MKSHIKILSILSFCVLGIVAQEINSVRATENKHSIGLCIMATGKYVQFASQLIESAERYFLPEHDRTYFVFTDSVDKVPQDQNIIPVYQKRLGWPYDTMMRCSVYIQHADLYKYLDYMFASDADMRFVDIVGNEILGMRVATQHPGYVGKRGTYETNPLSCAYVRPNEGSIYFAGGFYGGSKDEFIAMNQILFERITADLQQGIMPVWHDESHLNRYFIDYKPTIILSPSYCYPEGWNLNYHPRLLALNKNHAQMRAD